MNALDTKQEAPKTESLRWLIMVFDVVARMGVPIRGKRIMQAKVRTYLDDKGVRRPETSWETSGKVYVEVLLEDGLWRHWGIPVGAVNNRDTKWVLTAVLEDARVADVIMGSNRTIQNLRRVS